MLISMSKPTANGRAAVNLERRLDHDGHPLAITAADAVAASGVSPWNWRDNPGNGPCNRFPPMAICRLSILKYLNTASGRVKLVIYSLLCVLKLISRAS